MNEYEVVFVNGDDCAVRADSWSTDEHGSIFFYSDHDIIYAVAPGHWTTMTRIKPEEEPAAPSSTKEQDDLISRYSVIEAIRGTLNEINGYYFRSDDRLDEFETYDGNLAGIYDLGNREASRHVGELLGRIKNMTAVKDGSKRS